MYPSWSDITQSERSLINNGCGPIWLPKKTKHFINKYLMTWAFYAGCGHHDFGYIVGGGEFRRWKCDFKLAQAMWKDVYICCKHGDYKNFAIGLVIGSIFYLSIILFGWSSFEYGKPKTLKCVRAYSRGAIGRTKLTDRLKKFRWK